MSTFGPELVNRKFLSPKIDQDNFPLWKEGKTNRSLQAEEAARGKLEAKLPGQVNTFCGF